MNLIIFKKLNGTAANLKYVQKAVSNIQRDTKIVI